MKIVYAGPLNRGGTCYSRLKGLHALPLDIVPFDTDSIFHEAPRLHRLFEQFCFVGPLYRRANRALLQLCSHSRPDVVWIDKGFWIWPGTLRQLRQRGIFLAEHNTDCLWPDHKAYWWSYALLRRTLTAFDLYFTSNRRDFDRLTRNRWAAPRIELTQLGYDPDRFSPCTPDRPPDERWSTKLVFIGHYEPRTARYLTTVAKTGLPLLVFGSGWQKARGNAELRPYLSPQSLSDETYETALRSAAIGLGFVSEWNGNETAGRTFEIPASGTMLLAMRTSEHVNLYQEGVEAEFFSSPDELTTKASRYLADPVRRRAVALAGRTRCEESGYTWQSIVQRDWMKLLAHRDVTIAGRLHHA